MGSMLTGLAAMRQRQAEIKEAVDNAGTFIPKLYPADGDVAKIRFLTDYENEVVSGDFHSIPLTAQSGKRWWKLFACTKETGQCEWCEKDNNAGFRFGMWLWVYYILHAVQKDTDWIAVTRGTTTLFKEEVDGPMLFVQGWRVSCTLTAYFDKRGTLNDRDYDVSRTGKKQQTLYTFDPDDPSEFTKDVPELPAIWDAMLDNVMMDGQSQTEWKEAKKQKTEQADAPPEKAVADIQDVNTLLAQLSVGGLFGEDDGEGEEGAEIPF